MDNILDIDLVIERNRYSKVYNFSFILFVIVLLVIYVIFTYKYQTYYHLKGKMINGELEILVPLEDIKVMQKKTYLIIDDREHLYQITHISEDLYVDYNYQNYGYLYLKVDGLSNIDNFVYNVKIPKENKVLAKYVKDYL